MEVLDRFGASVESEQGSRLEIARSLGPQAPVAAGLVLRTRCSTLGRRGRAPLRRGPGFETPDFVQCPPDEAPNPKDAGACP